MKEHLSTAFNGDELTLKGVLRGPLRTAIALVGLGLGVATALAIGHDARLGIALGAFFIAMGFYWAGRITRPVFDAGYGEPRHTTPTEALADAWKLAIQSTLGSKAESATGAAFGNNEFPYHRYGKSGDAQVGMQLRFHNPASHENPPQLPPADENSPAVFHMFTTYNLQGPSEASLLPNLRTDQAALYATAGNVLGRPLTWSQMFLMYDKLSAQGGTASFVLPTKPVTLKSLEPLRGTPLELGVMALLHDALCDDLKLGSLGREINLVGVQRRQESDRQSPTYITRWTFKNPPALNAKTEAILRSKLGSGFAICYPHASEDGSVVISMGVGALSEQGREREFGRWLQMFDAVVPKVRPAPVTAPTSVVDTPLRGRGMEHAPLYASEWSYPPGSGVTAASIVSEIAIAQEELSKLYGQAFDYVNAVSTGSGRVLVFCGFRETLDRLLDPNDSLQAKPEFEQALLVSRWANIFQSCGIFVTKTKATPTALSLDDSYDGMQRATFAMPEGFDPATIDDKALARLRDALKVEWVTRERDGVTGDLNIYFGRQPVLPPDANTAAETRDFWHYAMTSALGSKVQTVPTLRRAWASTASSGRTFSNYEFTLPAGMEYSTILSKEEQLLAMFVASLGKQSQPEMVDDPEVPGGQVALRDEKGDIVYLAADSIAYLKVRQEDAHPNAFVVTVSESNPITEAYLLGDLISSGVMDMRRRERNTSVKDWVDLSWIVGIGENGEPVVDNFLSGDNIHMVLAGATGGGKSVVLQSMLFQLTSKNSPEDLQLWMLEPKNGLEAFTALPHVRRFHWVSAQDPTEQWESVVELTDAAVVEMKRRQALTSGTKRSDYLSAGNLKEVREQRLADGESIDDLPYILLILEEAADFFSDVKPAQKEHAEMWQQARSNLSQLSRTARSAGIATVYITQYPTNANIPRIVKTNARKVGLRVEDAITSQAVIDASGLEVLRLPGQGIARASMEKFRAPWLGSELAVFDDYMRQAGAEERPREFGPNGLPRGELKAGSPRLFVPDF